MLTASYPLGHLPYGWLNTIKPVSPAFQLVCVCVCVCARACVCVCVHVCVYEHFVTLYWFTLHCRRKLGVTDPTLLARKLPFFAPVVLP